MILYSLKCSHDHVFDEWFSNISDYDVRKTAGDLVCPECGDKDVAKAMMAPRVGKSQPEPAPRCMPGGCGGCQFAGHE